MEEGRGWGELLRVVTLARANTKVVISSGSSFFLFSRRNPVLGCRGCRNKVASVQKAEHSKDLSGAGRDSSLVKAPDSSSKGCEFESRQERQEDFLLQS